MKLTLSLEACAKMVKTASNYIMVQKLKNTPTSMMLPHDQEGKSAILIKMLPLIKAKAFAADDGSPTNFGEFAVYYEVMKNASNYEKIDLVFNI